MKTKEKLAKEYEDQFLNGASGVEAVDFIAGWESAEEKLKQIITQIQKEDITSVVYALREVLKRMENE